jgi:hypothetical protein
MKQPVLCLRHAWWIFIVMFRFARENLSQCKIMFNNITVLQTALCLHCQQQSIKLLAIVLTGTSLKFSCIPCQCSFPNLVWKQIPYFSLQLQLLTMTHSSIYLSSFQFLLALAFISNKSQPLRLFLFDPRLLASQCSACPVCCQCFPVKNKLFACTPSTRINWMGTVQFQ